MESRRRPRFLFLLLDDAEYATALRWLKRAGWGLLVMTAAMTVFTRSGFFREQTQLKQARALIEGGGYAYCAIWGDGTDPFQLMARNSPGVPKWKGERQTDGTYLMTFTYRRSKKPYRHQWRVDLTEKRVTPVGEMSMPIPGGQNEMKCTER